jgi:hypothetical protein
MAFLVPTTRYSDDRRLERVFCCFDLAIRLQIAPKK